ncbi:MAG: hypothetical protein ACM30G_17620, partial [Micromonosporaceae bacterium]
PKVRLDFGPHEAAAAASTVVEPNPSRYANDLTMELPIFRELESAWFRAGDDTEDAASAGAGKGRPGGGNGRADEAATTGGTAGTATDTDSAGAPGGADEVSWRTVADDGWVAAMAASEPQDGGTTETGLPRRVPMAQLVPGGVESAAAGSERRTPEAVRGLLSAYHRGVQRGRSAGGKSPESTTTESQPAQGGKEQEA